MSKLIIVFIVIFSSCVKADEVWLQLGAVSKHSASVDSTTGIKYNEKHEGIGFEYHTKNYYFSAGKLNNSVDRDLRYIVAAKQWNMFRRNNFNIKLLTGVGAYGYEAKILNTHTETIAVYEDFAASSSSLQELKTSDPAIKSITEVTSQSLIDSESKGVAPWISVSMKYRSVGINLSYLPANLIDNINDNVITLQFKLKLK